MQSVDIIKKTIVKDTFRTNAIRSMFDIELQDNAIEERFSISHNIEERPWSVGVIFGSSGTGKSTIAKEIFGESFISSLRYRKDTSILESFDSSISIKEITKALSCVGISSPKSWLKSYESLSTGEKMRVDIARSLVNNEIVVFDEFTSVVDRQVAKFGSYAIQKFVRKCNKRFVAVSCHEDIIEWLEPDWIINANIMRFFFAKTNTKGLNSSSTYVMPQDMIGNTLASIII